jgi:hypothetical protein
MSSKSKKRSKTKRSTSVKPKERGFWLSLLLVVMAVHGIFATYFYYTLRTQQAYLERPWILGLMVVHSFANIIAAIGIWYWKKWALYVYAASTILGVVVGLLSIGIWSVFYMVLPLVIVGWVLRTKWDYFT